MYDWGLNEIEFFTSCNSGLCNNHLEIELESDTISFTTKLDIFLYKIERIYFYFNKIE